MRIITRVGALLLAFMLSVRLGAQSSQTQVPTGVWDGKGIQLTVTTAGARIDYDCETGTIAGQLLFDRSGKFTASGTHSFGRGGPRQPGGAARKIHKASYEGSLDGVTMRLTVSLPDLGRKLGEFTLELGRRASLERCG